MPGRLLVPRQAAIVVALAEGERFVLRILAPLFVSTWFMASIAFADGAEGIGLISGEGLESWAGDTGDWVNAGDALLDPEDPQRLIARPGTGVLVNGPDGRTKHLISKVEHGDVNVHVEFMVSRGSNSGVYLQGRYEIQILDSYGKKRLTYSDCGAIYHRYDEVKRKGWEGHPPRLNASREPGEWQSFDIAFQAPRFDAEGNKTANAKFLRVMHNGQVIHENVEVTGPTRGSRWPDETPRAPLMLQGDHGPVAYRNVILTPLD